MELYTCKLRRRYINCNRSQENLWCWPQRHTGIHIRLKTNDISKWTDSILRDENTFKSPPTEVERAIEERHKAREERQARPILPPATPTMPSTAAPAIPIYGQPNPVPQIYGGGGGSNFTVNMAAPGSSAAAVDSQSVAREVAKILRGMDIPAVTHISPRPTTLQQPDPLRKRVHRDILSSPIRPEGVLRREIIRQLTDAFLRRESNAETETEFRTAIDAVRDSKLSVTSLFRVKADWYEEQGIARWIYEPFQAFIKPFCATWDRRQNEREAAQRGEQQSINDVRERARRYEEAEQRGYEEAEQRGTKRPLEAVEEEAVEEEAVEEDEVLSLSFPTQLSILDISSPVFPPSGRLSALGISSPVDLTNLGTSSTISLISDEVLEEEKDGEDEEEGVN